MRCPDNSQMCSVKKTCTDSKCTCHVSSICKSDYSGIEDDISSEDLKIYGATCLSIQKESLIIDIELIMKLMSKCAFGLFHNFNSVNLMILCIKVEISHLNKTKKLFWNRETKG